MVASGRKPDHPRPINGILGAITVMNWTFASSGISAICSTEFTTCPTSHYSFGADRSVGLRRALGHWLRHFGECVADVNLAADNVKRTPVKRQAAGEAGDRMFGGGIGR